MSEETKESARLKIAELVAKYAGQQADYESPDYNETQTRQDFINPFFKALGWDVDNEQGYAEAYREVVHELTVKIDGHTKRPDNAFRIGGNPVPLFLVETKKPSILLAAAADAAYQIRSYGWNKKIAVNILTNFREFAVYDCTPKPSPADNAAKARIRYFSYKNYSDEFDFLWNTFGRENIPKGGLDQFIQSDTQKKGTSAVDKEFLRMLEDWREHLAVSINKNNEGIGEEELNYAVQQTINRIVFLRMAEDRKIEPENSLQQAVGTGNFYQNVFRLFLQADAKYNSGLFDFEKDTVSPNLIIDNRIIKRIVSDLYYPNPYNFAIIPVEILGTAYERFLGRTIYLTSRHAVKVEEKPEVRKAGGVFYTPHYVVDYIVRNTVGELVAGKTPKQAAKIKILDPACGSGNFLLGAYQFLLDWHRDYYRKHCKPSKGHKSDPLTPQGELSTVEKKRILLNNIFGVDIDVNAAEMTKLSLLLKCMEGETEASIANTRRLFHERVLPDIDDNILVGNSLVNTDYYGIVPDDEDEKQIKPFNMQKAFAGVFKQGGFDAVIGNPPYVQMSMFHWFNDNQKNYLLQKYSSSMGRINTFGFFIEKGIQVLAPDGKLGVIVPNTVLTQEYYYELRKFILQNTHIEHIVSYEKRVFSGAVVETATLVLAKTKSAAKTITAFCRNHTKEITYTKKRISQKIFEHTHKNSFIVTSAAGDLRMKQNIDSHCSLKFDDISTINQAIALKKNRSALLYKNQRGKNYQPVLDGREISRYCTNWSGRYLRYDLKAIHSCKREDIFLSKEKIFFRRVASSLIGTLDTNRFYALNTLAVINKRENMNIDIRCLLGVFNSRLVNYYYIKFLKSTKNVFSEIQARQVGQIPFPNIDITKKKDKWQHDEIVHSVNKLLLLYQKLPAAANPQTVRQVRDKIAYYEEQIDQIVYQLYGLTDEEIKMIENESGEKDGHKTVHQ